MQFKLRHGESIFSAFLICAFIAAKSAVSLMLQECRKGRQEYPFVIQTVSASAYVLTAVFYGWQTTNDLGYTQGLMTLWGSWKDMAPAVIYSTLCALSGLLQAISQNYIDASFYIVLMQLTMVLVALGDRFVLKKEATFVLWCLVFVQTGIVICYVHTESTHEKAAKPRVAIADSPVQVDNDSSQRVVAAMQVIGIAVCLCAECCSATGAILQQKFMQVAKPGLPLSIKLWYQHLFGVLVILSTIFFDWRNVERITQHGFFGGWDRQVLLTMICMWLYAVVASYVTAYLSALTGAMSAAMVVIVISLHGVVYRGKVLTGLQIFLTAALVINSVAYTKQKEKVNSSSKQHWLG